MLIAVEKHEDIESILLGNGLSKRSSTYTGTIRLYVIENKTSITYTSNTANNYVFTQKQSSSKTGEAENEIPHLNIELSQQILDPILKESHAPKEYKLKETILFNNEIEIKLINIESGDIKVLTAVEGLDHAVEIFDDIPVETMPIGSAPLDKTLCLLFMRTLHI
ncbi:uncharacterized protein NEMAJ01_0544 [Nematocida major]|uniref:uncharacterized protein n=1 Tax=Nematocida major TaxID=1912982 RepID=UPI002008C12B|nr:uncharacterized protein NEMAJ01_0544 [Nematocida major]KAH9385648.1 hypothetical protein NEMAJ01_0544 [Nematocida major]